MTDIVDPLEVQQSGIVDPLDQQAMPSSASPAAQPTTKSWFNPQTVSNHLPLRLAADIGAGIGNSLQGLVNMPSDLMNRLIDHPTLGSAALSVATMGGNPLNVGMMSALKLADATGFKMPTSNIDTSTLLGVTNPNFGDKTLQFAAGLLPIGGSAAADAGGVENLSKDLLSAGKDIGSGISDVASGIKNTISPQGLANSIRNKLGNGASMSENAKSIADDIRNSLGYNQYSIAQRYAPLNKAMQGQPIMDWNFNSADFMDKIKGKAEGVEDLTKKYIADQSYDNADALQKQLGSEIRSYDHQEQSVGGIDAASKNMRDIYQKYRTQIINDMDSTASQINPDLAGLQKKAAQDYYDNITPYTSSNKTLKAIAEGDTTTPNSDDLTGIFKKMQSRQPDAINKIVSDIGGDINNRVLYNELGNYSLTKNPSSLLDAYRKLDEQGFSKYTNPNTDDMFNSLEKAIRNKKIMKVAGGTLGVGALGSYLKNQLSGGSSAGYGGE